MGRIIGRAFPARMGFVNNLRQTILSVVMGGVALTVVTVFASPFKANRGAVALVYLTIVAVVSLTGDLVSSAAVAIAASMCLWYFFAPPPSSARIDRPLDVAALVTFLATAVIITRLISKMHRLTHELQRREETLRRSEAYLAEAQKLSHTGSWAWSTATRETVYWSDEMFRIFEIDPQQGLPTTKAFLDRVHPDDRESMQEHMRKAVMEKAEYVHHHRIVLPGGAVKLIHAIGHPRLHATGEVVEYVGTAIDVTERKRAEEEREMLRQREAELSHINRVSMLGELTSSLAHELHQPITAAITNANTSLRWLARNEPDLAEAREAILRIVKDGARAAEIINRLRSFYKKGTPPQPELVDLNEVATEMLMLLRNEANRYSIVMRTELAPELPRAMADRVQLQQVLMNLMLNGIEAMKDRAGELTIRSQLTAEGQVLISVSDTGVGLPNEKLEQIFNAFFTTKPHGTGMGLSISRSIVESHGGRLWATGNSPRGARFHFTLPRIIEEHE